MNKTINGEKHGPWEIYHKNGQLSWKGNFVNGKRNGFCESYWESGQVFFKGNFLNGIEIGFFEVSTSSSCFNTIETTFFL